MYMSEVLCTVNLGIKSELDLQFGGEGEIVLIYISCLKGNSFSMEGWRTRNNFVSCYVCSKRDLATEQFN